MDILDYDGLILIMNSMHEQTILSLQSLWSGYANMYDFYTNVNVKIHRIEKLPT